MTLTTTSRLAAVLFALLAGQASADDGMRERARWVPVSGTGVHYFSTAIIHSTTPTDVGFIQRSTDTVELDGDLKGRVIYHPTSVFDFVAGTLTNTGNQVFSGTVLGSEPVLIHDDRFRFDVNLFEGRTVGRIFLTDTLAGPRIRCRLKVDGVGEETEAGDAVFAYTGVCRMPAGPRPNRWRILR
jgi:hypothetical protein